MNLKHFVLVLLLLSSVTWAQSSSPHAKDTSSASAPTASTAGRAAAGETSSQSGPSLEETLTWIASKMDDDAKYQHRVVDIFEGYRYSLKSDGCEVTFVEHLDASGTRYDGVKWAYVKDSWETLSLWDVDRIGNNYPIGGVDLYTSGAQQVKVRTVKTDNTTNAQEASYRTNKVEILFGTPNVDNEDLAKRVAKAFEHAVALCRDRKPTSNEPF